MLFQCYLYYKKEKNIYFKHYLSWWCRNKEINRTGLITGLYPKLGGAGFWNSLVGLIHDEAVFFYFNGKQIKTKVENKSAFHNSFNSKV